MFDARQLPTPDPYERTDARALTTNLVLAQIVQNVLGGIGAGVALAAALWLMGADLALAWRWPVGIAALVAGASTAWRAYLDEFRAERRWRKREAEHRGEMVVLANLTDRLEQECKTLRADRDKLRTDLHNVQNQLRSERYLALQARKPANPKHGGPIIDMYPQSTRDDAKVLVSRWYATGNWPGERSMGWTRDRHTQARQLLERVGIVVMGGKVGSTPPDKPPNTEAWALATLAAAYGIPPAEDDA